MDSHKKREKHMRAKSKAKESQIIETLVWFAKQAGRTQEEYSREINAILMDWKAKKII